MISSRSSTTRFARRPTMGRISLVAVALAVAVAAPRGQELHDHAAAQLGTVKFSNSCAPGVQPGFAHAMALLHSFEFGGATDAFKDVAEKDPACGIAWWGLALAQWG